MEILSTGQKIKRSRIYKGYTLKDLCGDKISVSKMSCVENDKINPEQWILEFVAEKLEIDAVYLKEDVKSQIIKNIENVEKSKYSNEYEKSLLYNLRFSEEYCYFDTCFHIMHLLFNYYLNENRIEKIQTIISNYYDCWKKCFTEDNGMVYYMDIARFFYSNKEFEQAANYYNNVREVCKKNKNYKLLAKAMYNEALCYVMMEDYEKAYGRAIELINLINYIEENIKKAEAYHMIAILCLRRNNIKDFEIYKEKAYELYENNLANKAEAIYNYAVVMFSLEIKEEAISYINNALACYPKDNKETLVNFMLMSINKLIENNVLDRAQEICDETLDYAIRLNNIRYIEKAYYYKALILEKQDNTAAGEMYMNLALDSLLKFASNSEVYKRYMEMGNMYHKMGNVRESIKYFNVAIQLEKKMK